MIDLTTLPVECLPYGSAGNDITGLDETQYDNAAADPSASSTPHVRNNAGTLKVRLQNTRTNTTFRPWGIISDTSGSPAAGIGVGMLFECESADEAPSSFMALDAVATDVTAASEDTDFLVLLRAAGAALAEKFRVKSTGALALADTSADPAAAEIARNGNVLKWRVEDNRTNSVIRPLGVAATTSGSPAAGIGTGFLLQAESGDEVPSDAGAIDAVLTDVGAGTEDSRIDLLTRVAGAALTATYGFQATGAFRALFTHALTATRTFTLPDADGTIATTATAIESGTWTADLGPSGTAARAVDTIYQNTSGKKRRVALSMSYGNGDNSCNVQVENANPPTALLAQTGQDAASGAQMKHAVTFEVPNNWFYRAATASGTATITRWREMDE